LLKRPYDMPFDYFKFIFYKITSPPPWHMSWSYELHDYLSSLTNVPSPSSQKHLKFVTFIITLALLNVPIPLPHKPMFTNPIVEYIYIHHT
jgi:hypothetical protein